MLEAQIDQYLRRFQSKQLLKPRQCQLCKQAGGLQWHGSYTRGLIAFTKSYSVPIRRLRCTNCRHTFALLPIFVIKFRRYAKSIICYALNKLATHTYEAVCDLLAQTLPHANLATRTLHFWRRQAI